MVTPDLDDKELDLVYERTERTIDVRKIHTKRELQEAVDDAREGRGSWSSKINEGVFEKLQEVRATIKQKILAKVKGKKKPLSLGEIGKKKFQAVFNKGSKASYFVARDAKGRFTKYLKKELDEAIYNGKM